MNYLPRLKEPSHKNSNFTVEEPETTIELTLQIMGQNSITWRLIQYPGKHTILLLYFSCQKRNKLNLIMKKYQRSPNWGKFYKVTGLFSPKISILWNTEEKDHKRFFKELKRHKNEMQYMILDWILNQGEKKKNKKNPLRTLSNQLEKTWIRSMA